MKNCGLLRLCAPLRAHANLLLAHAPSLVFGCSCDTLALVFGVSHLGEVGGVLPGQTPAVFAGVR